MAWSTKVRSALNASLNVVGLELSTTRAKRSEARRLQAVAARGWSTPRFAPGLHLEDAKYLRFLGEVCLPYREKYATWPRSTSEDGNGFYLDNIWFGAVDAEVLYSIVRFYCPSSIVEVGSGFSTRLMSRAISDGSLQTRLRSIDPLPRVEIQEYAHEQLQNRVEELDPSELAPSLGANDILFIDSSHVVTNGGDVPYLFLEVVPRLVPGVLIHVHDIFVPFDYPQEWIVKNGWNWNEQYLVQALIYGSNTLEIVWPAHYMWRCHGHELRQIIPTDLGRLGPSSLWLRKVM